jgi:hypothetical protein
VAARGFRAATARDAGQLSKPDSEQLAYAVEQGLCVVTHNREDFEELHLQYIAANRDYAGIIIALRRRPYQIAVRLVQLLNRITADEMRNQLLYI